MPAYRPLTYFKLLRVKRLGRCKDSRGLREGKGKGKGTPTGHLKSSTIRPPILCCNSSSDNSTISVDKSCIVRHLMESFAWFVKFFLFMVFFYLIGWVVSFHTILTKETRPHPVTHTLTLLTEALTFLNLKSQNKNCFWLRPETSSPIANSPVSTPISINSYPALALLSPESGYGANLLCGVRSVCPYPYSQGFGSDSIMSVPL
jgi:hypothetical protein